MAAGTGDGSAGDAGYGSIGPAYTRCRRADPVMAAAVAGAADRAGR